MDFKEYLKTQCPVEHKYLAEKMWPKNQNAGIYLSMKLNGKRAWTVKDELSARKVLHDLGHELIKL